MINLKYYISQIKAEVKYFPKTLKYLFSIKKKAIYIGCTDQGNLGDEAILQAVALMLKSDFHLYVVSYLKPSSGKYLGKLFIKNPHCIILGGGTIIRKGANESYLKILNDSLKLWPKAKVATLGPGVSEPYFADFIGFPIDIEGWKKFLNTSNFISVRGIRSKLLLDNWNLNKEVKIFHDPAIWFTKEHFAMKKKQKRIGLNFADIGNRIYGKNQDKIKSFAVNFINILQREGWTIFLYPTTKSDMNFMLHNIGLENISGLKKYNNYTNITASLDFMESLDVFVGQRLHSVIFAATVSTPFFALEYEPKTKDFLETIAMTDYSAQVDRMEAYEIFKNVEKIYSNLDFEQSLLHKIMIKAKEEQQQCLKIFLNTMKK